MCPHPAVESSVPKQSARGARDLSILTKTVRYQQVSNNYRPRVGPKEVLLFHFLFSFCFYCHVFKRVQTVAHDFSRPLLAVRVTAR